MVSMHTSPLDAPGVGDAGGMNVYIAETAAKLANTGIAVDIFTRARNESELGASQLTDGVLVHGVPAGPVAPVPKEDLPGLVVPFTRELLTYRDLLGGPGFDVVHGHYWLSGLAGTIAAQRWRVPQVLTMHTAAKVKNREMAGLAPREPALRVLAEQDLVHRVDALTANTAAERQDLVREYQADPGNVSVVTPGVDLGMFQPGSQAAARQRVGLPATAQTLLFVGRVQRLKAPDHLLRVVHEMLGRDPDLRRTLRIVICGGSSGSGEVDTQSLRQLAEQLQLSDLLAVEPATSPERLADWYRAADITVVPSYSETFGLVALESLAAGTPVVASDVGGLRTAVGVGNGGVLVPSRHVSEWGQILRDLLGNPRKRSELAAAGVAHARGFDWAYTAWNTLAVYRGAMERAANGADRPAAMPVEGR
ncbi:MAG: D-inositol-3-phosphate glycosyltransferase [Actinomycetia bacterium]|nr:D-inositol-3-phosphate glycosyltransferase [Actinomycetes bacterium]